MELRAQNPLEKIKIKDLCALACINKSTFYAHYQDIYALAKQLRKQAHPVYSGQCTPHQCRACHCTGRDS